MGELTARDDSGGSGRLAGGVGGATNGGGLFHHLHDGHGGHPVFGDEQLDGIDTRADGDSGNTGSVFVRASADGKVGMGAAGGILLRADVLGNAQFQALGIGTHSSRHQRGRNLLPEPGQECGAGQATILRAWRDAGGGSGCAICPLRFLH